MSEQISYTLDDVTLLRQLAVTITATDPDDIVKGEPYSWSERLTATWVPGKKLPDSVQRDGYWLLGGDSVGAEQLIVYPYMIEALVTLLGEMVQAGE